jgi:hypothetical protein
MLNKPVDGDWMMKELAEIIGALLAICAVVWLWLRINLFFYEHDLGMRRNRGGKVEIQTLFHGNTKDEDQI